MALTNPEDKAIVSAAAGEFLKICMGHGIKGEQVLQTTLAVASAQIQIETKGDRKYAKELIRRYMKSLESAVFAKK